MSGARTQDLRAPTRASRASLTGVPADRRGKPEGFPVAPKTSTAATIPAAPRNMTAVAVISLLHEPSHWSATRLFHGQPVLRQTLARLSRCQSLSSVVILCWDDQAAAARGAAVDTAAAVNSRGPRTPLPGVEAVSAARRWADGWRGGLLGACAFDAGFFGPWVRDAVERAGGDAAVLIDPAAALVDPALVDALVAHAEARPDSELCFAPAAPGLGGVLLRKPLLGKFGAAGRAVAHPGQLLHYHPGRVSREMLAGEACAPVPTPAARTTHCFLLSSERQVRRLEASTASMADRLAAAGAEELVACVMGWARSTPAAGATDVLPRDVVLELTTARATRPTFWPGRYHDLSRSALSLETARRLFDELSELDDTRLTLAGAGDPLLAENLFEVIDAARSAGLAVHVETDLLHVPAAAVRRLAHSGIDVLSVHLPALTPKTYETIMGVDGYRRVLESVEVFVQERAGHPAPLPLLAPLFVKCRENVLEMEGWYDQWLRAAGSAVIVGPSEFAGLVPDVAAADMTPPRRRPCARLASRVTVLSDGRIVSCEQDVLGRQELGRVGADRLADVWRRGFAQLREGHARQELGGCPVCAQCKEWHRP